MKIKKIIVISLVFVLIVFIQISYNSCRQDGTKTSFVEITDIYSLLYQGDFRYHPHIIDTSEIVSSNGLLFEIRSHTTSPEVNQKSKSTLIQNSFADGFLLCLKGNIQNIAIFSDKDYNSSFKANDTLNKLFTITVSYFGECDYISEDRSIDDFVKSHPTSCDLILKLNAPPDSLRKQVFTFHYRETDGDFFEAKTQPIQIKP
jgi:hypothetical protein